MLVLHSGAAVTRISPVQLSILAAWAVVSPLAISNCEQPDDSEAVRGAARLVIHVSDSAHARLMKLSASLNDVAAGLVRVDTLSSDLMLGAGNDGFGHIADVAGLGDGRFAVLDRLQKRITVYDETGVNAVLLGREGRGPGEFDDPYALAVVGTHLVVWDSDPSRTFTVLDQDGDVRATARTPVDGDWARIPFRGPRLRMEWPYQMTPEDVTRRLAAFGNDWFLHQTQPDETVAAMYELPLNNDQPPAYLIRYDLGIRVVDTLAILAAPANLRNTQFQNAFPTYDQAIFAARPVWTTGDRWVAIGHGDSTHIVVRSFDGAHVATIRWPGARVPITDEERLALGEWYVQEHLLKDLSEQTRRMFASAPARDEAVRRVAFSIYPFADNEPTITAAHGAGSCLWLGGFSAIDSFDATAHAWVGINLVTVTLAGVIYVPRRGARIRDIDPHAVYATFRDDDGVHHLERYPIGGYGCTSRE